MGASGKQTEPANPQDTGSSTQKAYLVDLISHGHCEGVLPGASTGNILESVVFDKTRVMNPDGSTNFNGFKARQRRGLFTQDPLKGPLGEETATPYTVNAVVKQATGAVTRTIINPELDAVRVQLQLQLYKENGAKKTGMEFAIYTKRGADPWKRRLKREIVGLFRTAIVLEYEFSFANIRGSNNEFQVRVERLSEDVDDDNTKVKVLRWTYYYEITKDPINYSNRAYCGLEFDAKNFQSIPERLYYFGGEKRLIPHNLFVREADRGLDFTPDSNNQAIPFNGSFYSAPIATQCPATLLFNLLIDPVVNPRAIPTSKIDLYSVYETIIRCNEFMPDGRGGFHRRYGFNGQIQTRERLRDLLFNIIPSTFHCKIVEYRNKLIFWQDKPTPVSWQFTNVDVEDGKFIYSETEHRKKYNVCNVTWYDPNNYNEEILEQVIDERAIDEWRGTNTLDIKILGCDDRFRAIRGGRWAIFSSFYENQFVTFKARAFSVLARLGQVIEIQDNRDLPQRYGGLVVSCSADRRVITLDEPVRIQRQSFLKCLLPDGTLEQKPIQNSIGYVGTQITLAQPFSQIIPKEYSWVLVDAVATPTKWRITRMKPETSDPTKIEITAINYVDEKWDYIDKELPITTPVGAINTAFAVTRPLGVTLSKDGRRLRATVAFPTDPLVTGAIVEYSRAESGVWASLGLATRSSVTVESEELSVNSNQYVVRVSSQDVKGRYSPYIYSIGSITIP